MSQGWYTLLSSHTLWMSRQYLNGNFIALMSNFSGPSAPIDYEEGSSYYNINDKWIYWRGAGGWHKIFQATGEGGNLLPRSGGSGFPMSGALYMGSKQIKNVASPTDNQDAATKSWTINAIDSHYHTGGGAGSGPRVNWNHLITNAGDAGQSLLQCDGQGFLQNRQQQGFHSLNSIGIPHDHEGDIATVSVYARANERKYILYGFQLGGPNYASVAVRKDDLLIHGPYNVSATDQHCYILPYTNTTGSNTYNWRVTLNAYWTGMTAKNRFILVL